MVYVLSHERYSDGGIFQGWNKGSTAFLPDLPINRTNIIKTAEEPFRVSRASLGIGSCGQKKSWQSKVRPNPAILAARCVKMDCIAKILVISFV